MKTLKFLCVYSILVVTAFQTFSQTTGEKPNFIFIIVDDLNDYVEPLGGHPQVKTPHITQLAQNGYVFNNAFCSTPVCAPSRTSILSGKTTQYTQIYSNDQYLPEFRDNFTAANGNEEVITLPEHLKNNGYYTYGIGKIFHSAYNKDFDDSNPDPCEKELSWSKVIVPNTANSLEDSFDLMTEGVEKFVWSRIDSSYEKKLKDYKSIDSAIVFLQEVNDGSLPVCEENFFLAIGMSLPHLNLHVPEQYFNEHYLVDIYEEPFNKPYNDPYNAFPYNGIVMPPQPEVRWDDYDALGVLGKDVALGQGDIETSILNYRLGLSYLPEIDPLLSIEGRNYIIEESKRANALMAYIAGVQFMDAQVGRLLETLNTMPTLAENTIIIFVSDNGFSLGEKHHWLKRSFWETDIRVPLIVYDPSLPATIYCNQTLSMLDLYPTICDIAGITHPLFSDESKYLDGQSFFPVLNDPLIKWSKPATISWEAEPPRDCSCYPQFAVRSDKFSYIKYQSDGSDPVHDCIESESFFEEELYEVGEKRQTDPYEWYNLIADEDYTPVVQYLQQFLPDSSLYLQKMHTAVITSKSPICFYKYSSTMKLKANLYDTEGVAITVGSLPDYTFRWTNNLTTTEYTGPNISIPMSAIPFSLFSTEKRIMIYLHVYDDAGNLVAFSTEYYYINPANRPVVDYTVTIDGFEVSITDYTITGSYNNTSWDFGDGFLTEDFLPAAHAYAASGAYTIKNLVQYGNNCTLVKQKSVTITPEMVSSNKEDIRLYPVPASDYIKIEVLSSDELQLVEIFTISGAFLGNYYTFDISGNDYLIDVSELTDGMYVMKIYDTFNVYEKKFQVLR